LRISLTQPGHSIATATTVGRVAQAASLDLAVSSRRLTTGAGWSRISSVDCPVCGRTNRSGIRFCEGCGAALARACPQCNENVPAEARFCGACGQLLDSFVEPQEPAASAAPAALAERIRRQRPAEGERRIVTVLFVDAVESTPLAERLGEEGMYSLMRGATERMSDAVHAHEGYVATFTGDGMMALFGAPIAHEDSARRAVAAALRMQSALASYAEDIERRHGVSCRFRVGLNTGPVVVGTVTDDLRMDFTAIGDTVNLAARMEQGADPGAVLISEHTHRAVADFFECERVGDLAVKGQAELVPGWRVIRETAVRTRFEAAAERGLSRLVGRDRQLALLKERVEESLRGSGEVVFVSGEAGIGKSRLMLELRTAVEGPSARWLEGRCVSFARNSAYLPVIDLLKRVFGIVDGDDEAAIITRVDGTVAGWDESAQKRVPYLKYLLSVDPGDESVGLMDPQERRVEIFDALEALVTEDLHWADQMSLEALERLMAVVPGLPVLLLITHRPDYEPPPHQIRVLRLEPLDDAESTALTGDVLGVTALAPDLASLITSKAEGNPFYIEEVSKSLVECGVLARVDETYRLGRPIEEVQLPGSVQEVILSRIDRLESESREVMQLAAVVGREFTARVIERMSDLHAQLFEVLGDLSHLELIFEKTRFPELAYVFKHALIHDVAYATLMADRRRALHRLAGTAIEALYADRLAEHYETLAHHYSEGQDWEKALDFLDKAGDKAAAAYANRDAAEFYGRALEVCATLGGDALPASASLAARRAFAHFGLGDVAGAVSDFDRMLDAARRLGNRSLEGTALAFRGYMQVWTNDWEQAEASLRSAQAIAEDGFDEVRPLANLGMVLLRFTGNRLPEVKPFLLSVDEIAGLPDPFLEGQWRVMLGGVQHWFGRDREAVGTARHLSDAAGRIVGNRLWTGWVETMALGTLGEYEETLRLLETLQSTSERVGDVLITPRLLNTLGWIFGELQDLQRGLEWNQACVEFVQGIPGFPNPDVEAHARLNLGDYLVALGRPVEAEVHFQAAEARFRSPLPADRWMAWRYGQHLFHSYGELWLARGDLDRARAYADECLELALFHSSTKNIVKARRLQAQILLARGRFKEAEEELAAALATAHEVGNPPQLWKTHAAIGELRDVQGRSTEALMAYREAVAVIDRVAAGLTDESLRVILLSSDHVQRLREAAELAK
jgi:class 3 adenylate cyclase/tetratricopeptide (TPR) repeat protein